MKAVYCERPGGVDVLVDGEVERPTPGPRDVLVGVAAISVNPIDIKQRVNAPAPATAGAAVVFPEGRRVLGYDASGVVAEVGRDVTLFAPGDEVYAMGGVHRPGSYAEFFCVDERQIALKPTTLTHSQAAALPLTGLTAWELLFDRMRVPRKGTGQTAGRNGVLLVINGAGGVGSMAVQLAAALTDLTIVATASRPESIAWVRALGAHHVIDHHRPLDEGLREVGLPEADYIASLTATEGNMAAIVRALAPQGMVGIIDAPAELDIVPLKGKSAAIAWEGVFIRSFLQTPDWIAQHQILREVASLIDAGRLKSTMVEEKGPISAANLARAHMHVASGRAIGKVVLTGFN